MLILVKTLSTFGGSAYHPAESLLGLKASKWFIINSDNIEKYKVYGTTDSYLLYKLNKNDDRSPKFSLIVDQTNAAIKTASDVTPANALISLSVYEGALTYSDVADISSTTTMRFKVKDIVWCIRNEDDDATMILVEEGGFTLRKYFVEQGVVDIIAIAGTGTTTTSTTSTSSTSTSSTSSTSTSSTSTSTSSTSTTSTSSTSTTSTSTTSTSSTSTSSTSTSTIA
jgi:hypothetical protein